MLESKWVLFIMVTFVLGNLLASSIDDGFTGNVDLVRVSQTISTEDIDQITPDDDSAEQVRAGGVFAIGTALRLVSGLPEALTWDYSFLNDNTAAGLFRAIFLYPLSFMFSLMMLGFLKTMLRI